MAKPKKLNVLFHASGYGTKKFTYNSREELMQDAEGTAAELEGTVQDYGDEIVAIDPSGDEIARWNIV